MENRDFGAALDHADDDVLRLLIDGEVDGLAALIAVMKSRPYQDLDLLTALRLARRRLIRYRDRHF